MSDNVPDNESEVPPKSHRRLYLLIILLTVVALISGAFYVESASETNSQVPYYMQGGVRQFTKEPNVERGFSLSKTNEQTQLNACLMAFTDFQASIKTQPSPLGSTDVNDQIAYIAAGVAKTRGLDFKSIPVPEFVSAEEMQKRVSSSISDEKSEDDKNTQDELVLLTLVPQSTDINSTFKKAYSSSVLGFYDPKSKKLVVLGGNKSLSTDDQFVMAHELDHAVTDSAIGQPKLKSGDPEAVGAKMSLAEGDATFEMQLYALQFFTRSQLEEIANSSNSTEVSEDSLIGAPAIIQNAISFPYSEGANFVCHLYEKGGWKAVNAAYKKPPRTTVEIMFPDRYGKSYPMPKDEFLVPKGWKKAETSTFGASDLYQLLAYPRNMPKLGLADARSRSAGWAGGFLDYWKNGNQKAIGVTIKQQPDAPDVCESIAGWAIAAYPTAENARASATYQRSNANSTFVLRCTGDKVHFVVAPSASTAYTFLDKT